MKVDFYLHNLNSSHAELIAKVLDTPFLTSGAVGKHVESMLCDFFGTTEGLLVNSWTNGALAVLLALEIGPGDEVIVPAMTFIATSNIVEMLGGRPVFVDVDPDTLLLTPEAVKAALTPRTKAVIPVHLYGQMCDMTGIQEVLRDRPDVTVIEDCAHCFEGSRDGYLPGKHSDCAVFSFYATKNVACGEGGAIVTNDANLAGRIRQTRLHGMSQGAADRFKLGQYRHWDMELLGTKANLPDLLAAFLPHQVEAIRGMLPERQAIANRYRNAFSGAGIGMQKMLPNCSSAEHVFTIHVPPPVRDEAIAALNRREVGVAVNYRSVPTLTYYARKYGYTPESFPVSYNWGAGTITLPLYQSLPKDKQDWVIQSVLEDVVPLCEGVHSARAR